MGSENFPEGFVVGVGQVGGPVCLRGKGQGEAVGKSLIQAFRAVVQAPLEMEDLRDLRWQGCKGLFDLGYLTVTPELRVEVSGRLAEEWKGELEEGEDVKEFVDVRLYSTRLCVSDFKTGTLNDEYGVQVLGT